ncbi:uncharacterized protein LOC105248929 isoform X1 [Camponotus floridanus]|uniref:uncharacterized protein LOC105248929 isoform X1 n=1 Tax=Camponotus floridanus TaxID=104421 RepID=UPI00059E5190|nr:uncharacterized protein LOC105248929 isoform X1 [Camponotus floridanus]
MLSARILTVFLGIISSSIALISYTSTLMRESMTVYDTSIFSLKELDNNTVYLQIKKKILETDKLYLNIVLERFDGVKFPIPEDPIRLCKLLEEEAKHDNILSKLRFSRVFNMEGMHCPIPAGKRKLMPYFFPQYFKLYNDIGCGLFRCKVIIELCDEETLQTCMPLISEEIIVEMQAEYCSNILM